MLKFGIVTNLDESKAQARVQFNDSDSMVSYWLFVLQAKTYKDKFYALPDIGEQVACLMDENIEEGVIIGSVYSALDEVPVISKDKVKIKFEDGAEFEYDRKLSVLSILCPTINIEGIINHTGLLLNSAGVVSEGEVIDHTGSMQAIRGIYNAHTHNETNSVTQKPNQGMS
ncbi:MAG: phage baseplate assembly protein V [bacterium]